MKKKSYEGLCEICGHYVKIRQKAHIIAEDKRTGDNILMLCPTCHIMFDTQVKPKLHKALERYGVKKIPASWKKSIYQQAAEASQAVLKNKRKGRKKRSGVKA